MKIKYKQAFLDMAEVFAQTSEATRLKVGCLIVKQDNIISVGVNGTPKGFWTNLCEDENNKTFDFVNHAEANALNKLIRSAESSVGAMMFVTHNPCLGCAIKIAEADIREVYFKHLYRCDKGLEYLSKRGIIFTQLK